MPSHHHNMNHLTPENYSSFALNIMNIFCGILAKNGVADDTAATPPFRIPPLQSINVNERIKKRPRANAIDETFSERFRADPPSLVPEPPAKRCNHGKIHPAYAEVRDQVLEVCQTVDGNAFFQCRCCKHLHCDERAKLSILAPRRIEHIARAVLRFMTTHVPACEHISREIKDLNIESFGDGKTMAVKKFWVESAGRLGLKDGDDGRIILSIPQRGERSFS